MKIDILTLFPTMFKGPFDESIVKRAQEKGLVKINLHDLRKWTKDQRGTVDDRPFGGGVGMILMVEPIYKALKELKSEIRISTASASRQPPLRRFGRESETNSKSKNKNSKQSAISNQQSAILLSPQGKVFSQKMAQNLSKLKHLIFICGHYEGIDERVRKHLVDEEISIGDYILTGGELPAMVVVDTLIRLIPGVLEKPEAVKDESFSNYHTTVRGNYSTNSFLEYPQYTRPANFKGWKVPEVLLSGNHPKIAEWREKQSLKRTKTRRPDLLQKT